MSATTYRIWGWGPRVDATTEGARRIGVAGIAKPATPDAPFRVFNEILCSDLGRAIRLPIPPGFVVVSEHDKVLHYVSADFSQAGEILPPADARSITSNSPALACGVILFDLWVANADRFEANLSYDEKSNTLQIFDHGRALLCGKNGRQRLGEINDRDIIDSNCLSAELDSTEGFDSWQNRITEIPSYFIEESVGDAIRTGLQREDDDLKQFCVAFLLDRRAKLSHLVKQHKDVFVNAKDDLFRQ